MAVKWATVGQKGRPMAARAPSVHPIVAHFQSLLHLEAMIPEVGTVHLAYGYIRSLMDVYSECTVIEAHLNPCMPFAVHFLSSPPTPELGAMVPQPIAVHSSKYRRQ